MDLRDYLGVLRRSWILITVFTLLGISAAAGISLLVTPVYQARAQLFISMADESGSAAGAAYTGALFAQQRVQSYTAIVDTPAVLEPVIEALDLPTTPTAMAALVTAQAPTGTVLINVTGTSTDAVQAALITNAVAQSFAEEIVRLETPDGADSAPVKPSVTMPAVEPRVPIAPRTRVNIALGALLGLAAGVGISLLRHTLDTTVKTAADAADAAGSTVLGSIAFDSQAKSSPLGALDQTSVRSESIRSIRTNLQYVNVDQPPRCVVITSAVPGEGKSTTACNLAITLAQAGSRVILVEADMRRPRVADYFGIEGSIGLTDILIGKRTVDEVVIAWNRGLVDVLPSGPIPPNPSELLGSHQMSALLADLRHLYDVVLLDAPPLLPVTDAAVLTSLSDGAILIARHGQTKREQVTAAADALGQAGGRLLGVVLNFAPQRGGRSGYGYGYGHGHDYGDNETSRARLSVEEVEAARSVADGFDRADVPASKETAPASKAARPTQPGSTPHAGS